MFGFKKERKETDLRDHDFNTIVKNARKDEAHFERIRAAFSHLVVTPKERKK